MNRIVGTIVLVLIALSGFSQAQPMLLEGHYQGKNLYVQNPFAGTGVGFCVYEVTINDEVTTDEIGSSAFEIDFSNFQLNIGDPVAIVIKHKSDCRPKVLNPEVLKPKSTFEVTNIIVTKEGVLNWKTKNETGKLDYIIEQYRWNKWIKVGEVLGEGAPTEQEYKFQITPHSGENQFRVKQVDYSGKPRYSKAVKYRNPSIPEVTFSPYKVSKLIEFSSETLFEIYDQFGNLVKRGFAKEINCINLKKGVYYLNYDNKTDKFIKK